MRHTLNSGYPADWGLNVLMSWEVPAVRAAGMWRPGRGGSGSLAAVSGLLRWRVPRAINTDIRRQVLAGGWWAVLPLASTYRFCLGL